MNETDTFPALSVRWPWAWLIVHGHKDIENRPWATSFRGRVLIHASKSYTREERRARRLVAEQFGIDVPEPEQLGGIVGSVEIADCVSASDSPWFLEGGYGFVLRNPEVLPFRPIAGRLGFFNVRGERSYITRPHEADF